MIAYVIEACKESNKLNEIYINSESKIFKKIADQYGIKFYKRDRLLAKDDVAQDQFNYDFLKKIHTDVLVMVNPVSPLVMPEDIDTCIDHFEKNNLDSLITVKEEQFHAFYKDNPINFRTDRLLPMTQKINPIQICTWNICIWRTKKFIENFERYGHAVFIGKCGLYPFDPIRSLKVSTENDFYLAELYLSLKKRKKSEISFYSG